MAEVTQDGHLTTLRSGEAALLVRYEGRFVPLPVTVLEGRPGFQWTQLPQHNYIDRHVDAKLKKVEILPSEIASDAEFLRRVYLDLIGIPPTPEETRAFLADPGEQRLKRSRCIDKLIARPEFVDHWAVKWGDLFQNTRKFVGDKGVWQFRDWIRRSLAENKPYDQWVRELLTAQGSTFENPAANFFRIAKTPKWRWRRPPRCFWVFGWFVRSATIILLSMDAESVLPDGGLLFDHRRQGRNR